MNAARLMMMWAAKKMSSQPRQESREERSRPRRAPRLLEVRPLARLPTKPPKLGDDPIQDSSSMVRFREVRIEGRAAAGQATATPKVKYPKLATSAKRKILALILWRWKLQLC